MSLPRLVAGLLLACGVLAMPARSEATTTRCSDPAREQVLGTTTVVVTADDLVLFEEFMTELALDLGMSPWVVTAREHGQLTSKDIGLQSPAASVAIDFAWEPGMEVVEIEIWRTCISDDLEPWEGYWTGFLAALDASRFHPAAI